MMVFSSTPGGRRRRKAPLPITQPASLIIAVMCSPSPLIQAARQADLDRGSEPLLVVSESERVLAVCPAAWAAGVRLGQRLVQARLLCPEVRWALPDAVAAMVLYEDLLAALSTVSPLVEAADPESGIAYLDGRGLSRLVGDPSAIGRAAVTAGESAGVTVQAGAGPNRLLALVVARREHTAGPSSYLPDEEARRLLHAMPLTDPLFAVPTPLLEQFDELGVRTAGALAAVPRAALALRFEARVLSLWDALTGTPEPPLRPWSAPSVLTVRHTADDGVDDRLVVESLLTNLADVLVDRLTAHGQAAAQLTLRMQYLVSARQARSRHWPPLAAGGPLKRAAQALLDRVLSEPTAQPVSVIRLDAGELGPDPGMQAPLFGDPSTARRQRLAAVLTDQTDRYGISVLGQWQVDPLSPDGWTRTSGPP